MFNKKFYTLPYILFRSKIDFNFYVSYLLFILNERYRETVIYHGVK